MNTTEREKSVKELLLGKTWQYLNDNFHKFKQAQKIKIALTLCQKDMPQEFTGLSQQIVVMNDIIRKDKEARYDIGQRTDIVEPAAETFTDH